MIAAGILALISMTGEAGPPRLGRAEASVPAESLVGGGIAVLALTVEEGRVVATRRLQGGEAWLELLEGDSVGWRFEPDDARGSVIAVGLYRPPQLYLDVEPAPGPPPAEAGEGLPYPVRIAQPAYPPGAAGDAGVVIELLVTEDGAAAEPRVVSPTSAFDEVALSAAAGWRFRPARRGGRAVPDRACLVFVFRSPIAPSPPR